MNTTLRTCNHLYDTGGTCSSVAAKDSDYCTYHLHYRARQLRRAQARARGERFELRLPPLESMHAVHSALTQLAEALAAGMIDPKCADRLIRVLNIASRNLLKSDKWPASIAHSDQPGPAVDLAAEYGLPADLDLNTPPEVAFPRAAPVGSEVKESAPSHWPILASVAEVGRLPEIEFRPDSPVTPDMVEVIEIGRTEGADAAALRGNQLELNRRRRRQRADRKRYAAIAVQHNIRQAAEKLAEQKLAAEGGPQLPSSGNCGDESTQNLEVGCPIPPSVGGVGPFPDIPKKSVASSASQPYQEEAKSIA